MAAAARVLVITGASSGIGAATARLAAEAGYRVVLAARSIEPLEALAAELGGNDRALAIRCDVSEWDAQQQLVSRTLDAFGRIDVAFVNAAITSEPGYEGSSPEHWRSMILINVYGAALTIRAVLPAIKASRGDIVLTGSVAGQIGIPGSLYSATKWALRGIAQGLRLEVLEAGARVTLVEPGAVETPFFDKPGAGKRPPNISEMLQPADVARAVMYAVSQPSGVSVNEIVLRPTSQRP